jgi:hypothetical protein
MGSTPTPSRTFFMLMLDVILLNIGMLRVHMLNAVASLNSNFRVKLEILEVNFRGKV